MGQVIEVRILDPGTLEVLADEFTVANTHRHAVELALNAWSGGAGHIKSLEKWEGVAQGEYVNPGPAWKYAYSLVLEDDAREEGAQAFAILFTQYKEYEAKML